VEHPRFWSLPAEVRTLIETEEARAKAQGLMPSCGEGHGYLELHLSKKKKLYWRCAFPGCNEKAWYRELSYQLCPRCGRAMEVIPSKKVKGGNFLLCQNKDQHTDDVVLFRNKLTGHWEAPVSAIDTEQRAARTPYKKPPPAVQSQKILSDDQGRKYALQVLSFVKKNPSLNQDQTLEALAAQLNITKAQCVATIDALIDSDLLRFSPKDLTLRVTLQGERLIDN
jgi:hypothetical protein